MPQLITPNPNISCRPGYCLEYVRETFGLPVKYGSATEAWNNSPSQHQDYNFPAGLWFPVWFAIDIEPNGHVALMAPDGTVYSASDMTNTPHHHPSMDDLIAYYARWGKMTLTFLGWSEDVASFPVVSLISVDSTPTPQEDWFDMADKDTLKEAVREVLLEPGVLDAQTLAFLHRDCNLVDPSGLTGNVVGVTSLGKKVNWMAHNDAQILNALVAISQKLDIEHPVLLPETIDAPTPVLVAAPVANG